LEECKYNEPLNAIYRFFWNDFCDWYLEWCKPRMQDGEQKPIAQNVLAFVLDKTVRLLHPFVPFITESIFGSLNEISPVRKLKDLAEDESSKALIVAPWPNGLEGFIDEVAEQQVTLMQNIIRPVRDIRSKYNIAPSKMVAVSVGGPSGKVEILNKAGELICQMAGLSEFSADVGIEKPDNAAAVIVDDMQIYVHDVIDVQAERQRLIKQKEQIENGLNAVNGKLNNENFVSRAKPEVVAGAREKQEGLMEQLKAIEKYLCELGD